MDDILDQLLLFVALADIVDISVTVDRDSLILISDHNLPVARYIWPLLHITVGTHGTDWARNAGLRRVEQSTAAPHLLLCEHLCVSITALERLRQHSIRCLLAVVVYGGLTESSHSADTL